MALLERAVRSVLVQEGTELEIIVSDNASTDGTRDLCEELSAADPRIRILRHPTDIGAEANFRAVLDDARGPLFMWLADDDWIDPGYIAECAAVLDQNPDHVVACGRGRYYRGGEPAFAERPVNLLARSESRRLLGFYRTVTMNGPIYGVIRRERLLELPSRKAVGQRLARGRRTRIRGKDQDARKRGDPPLRRRSVTGSGHSPTSVRALAEAGPTLVLRRRAGGVQRHSRVIDYSRLRGPRRVMLASLAASIVVIRFGPKAVAAGWLARAGLLERARRPARTSSVAGVTPRAHDAGTHRASG